LKEVIMKSLLVAFRRHLTLASVFAFASLAAAQASLNSQLPLPATTPPPLPSGLLGNSYLFLDASRVDQSHANGSTTGATFGLNLAAAEFVDITTTFGWAKQRDWPDSGNIYQFGVDCTPHLNFGRVKLFGVGGIGYQFTRTPAGRDLRLWDAGAGVEFLVASRTSITVKAVNVGSFRKGVSNPWQYSASVNHWIAKDLALNASVTFIEDQATGYTLGVRRSF
jgi:hypothetical protein